MAKYAYDYFNTPASDEQVARVAPSVFTQQPHESRSERYAQITTAEILRGLRGEGWGVFGAGQTNAREGKKLHTKHMLRLRHLGGSSRSLTDSQSAAEIVLLNSHDGSSSYRMLAGMHVFACLNGLVRCGEGDKDVRIAHSGRAVDKVVAAAFETLDGLTRVVEDRDVMRGITLDHEEQHLLARAAITLQHGEGPAPVTTGRVLQPRRMADAGSDLWSVFNRVQESVIRGGVAGTSTTGSRMTTRPVTSLDRSVGLNRALWQLAEGMRQLKEGNAPASLLAAA